ncbi:hypothetical protein, partial [Mycobacterium sp. E1747]|uniref:hypothetical protein n=1 Tax=Mycobacterium sp. E1747 TaxID=1834128 RepID=UPI000A43BC22
DALAEKEAQEEASEPSEHLYDCVMASCICHDSPNYLPNPSAACGAVSAEAGCPAPLPPTGAGQPPLSSVELVDAAYAVRGFAETSPVPEVWLRLAEKLTAASAAQFSK